MDDRRLVKVSKYLSKHLRHEPERLETLERKAAREVSQPEEPRPPMRLVKEDREPEPEPDDGAGGGAEDVT